MPSTSRSVLVSLLAVFIAACSSSANPNSEQVPSCSQQPCDATGDLRVDVVMPVGEDGHQDFSAEEPTVRLFAIEPGCSVAKFETVGGCRRTDADPLGVYFAQFTSTCTTPSGPLMRSDFPADDGELRAHHDAFLAAHDSDAAFRGCMKPEVWKQYVEESCQLSACKRLVEAKPTMGRSVEFRGLAKGSYFVDVERKTFPEGKDQTGYYLGATKVDVTSGPQSVKKDVSRYSLIVEPAM